MAELVVDRLEPVDVHHDDADFAVKALGAREPVRAQMQQPPVPLDERAPAVAADHPADDRADDVAQRAGQGHGHVRPARIGDVVAEEDDVLRGKCPGGERARVEHHQLARGREDRVERHQREDRVDPVVADERGDGARDRREHRASLEISGGR